MLVLVCIDLTPLSEHIAQEAAKIASMTGASLSLLHAVRTTRGPDAGAPQLVPPEDMEYRVSQLDAMAARLRQTGTTVEAHVRLCEGPVHQLVVDEATRARADLILVGSNGRSRTFELFIGSCTQGVIRDAMVPVVVVNGVRSVGGPG
jgi:nucleotide-binding universal stress UspA family protein